MRSRHRLRRRAIFGGILALAVVIVAATMLAPDYGDNSASALPPQAMNKITQKNDNAAVDAAAAMRERSARTARITDSLADQQDRANGQ